jgi:hypothetical protein
MVFIWPEVFTNPSFEYGAKDERRALADALEGWGLCMCGAAVPEGFGKGMVKIASFYPGKAMTPEVSMELAQAKRGRK